MERELEIRQPANPVETASCFSRLLFSWVTPLFREGYRRTLQVEDLYACPKWERSESKADRLQAEWDKEIRKMKQGKRPNLLNAIFRAFGFTYIMVSLLVLIEECFKNVMQPVMLGWVVRYFAAPESISKTEFYLSAAGVSILGGMHIFTHHPYFFNMQRIGMRIRIACCSLVYRKALRLSQAALSKTAVGQMVNLLSNDVNRFDQSVLFVPYLVAGPLQTAIITWVLWQHLGISCIAGISFILLYIPFQGCLGRAFSRLRAKTAALTDERIRLVNEFVAGMRVIKMYTWEMPFALLVNDTRQREVRMIQRTSVLRAVNMGMFFMSSKLVLFLCFVTFALLGNTLTSECVFVSMSLFNSLRLAMTLYFPFGVGQGAETLISVKRLQKFLLLEEQEQTGALNGSKLRPKIHNCRVELQNATASWTKESSEPTLQNITATVKPGELLVVIGPVGSGKTSLLMTILGELRLSAGSAKALGRIAYASQEPWMFTGSLRNNVVFDSAYDQERYRKVIHAAAMERDLTLLPYGDRTLVGDRGVSLSGGQKARVNLARALYYDADIYLLDDPLSAVDTAVAKHLFEVCIRGYLKNKIVILCTHQLQFLKSANHILVLKEGKMLALGSYRQLQRAGIDFVSLLEEKATVLDSRRSSFDGLAEDVYSAPVGSETLDAASPGAFFESNLSLAGSYDDARSDIYQSTSDLKGGDVKLPVEAEEARSTGSVKGRVYWSYMRAGAGPLLMPLLFVSSILAQAIFNGSDFWLTYWTGQSEGAARAVMLNGTDAAVGETTTVLNRTENRTSAWTDWWSSLDTVTYNVLVYAIIIGGLLLSSMARTVAFFVMCMRASVNLHNRMFNCIIRAPIRFFDINPIGRIQNRFAKDLGTIDDLLPPTGLDITFIFLNLVGVLVVVAVISPWIIIPTLILFVLFFYLRRFYMRTARDVKRLEGVTRSPVFSHLSTSLYGLSTIRAFNAQRTFERMFDLKQDHHTSAWYMFLCTARWFGITLDSICFAYITIVTMSLALSSDGSVSGGGVGLAIANALMLTGMFQWGVRQSAEIESQMTSVERVLEYSCVEPEAQLESSPGKKPPATWPEHGAITFDGVSLSYTKGEPPVLKELHCHIKAREKIGVVGRTGAGKSSIIAALFRMTEPDGAILIDGVDIRFIGLHDLRSKISIIPQDPVLFTGPVRRNLDPFSEHSDTELWKALEEVRLKASIQDLQGGLSAEVSEGGGNFSVGQRQLICLARAVLRQNKILVMDEATANVDPRTDALIQTTIRENFANCTVITIAHRLHTIMDSDRVIVLDAGCIVEFDEPYELMKSESSQFTSMVQNTGPSMARQLWNMAREAHAQRRVHSHHEDVHRETEYIDETPPWFMTSRPDVVVSGRATEVIQEEDGEDGQCYTSL
ncbi:ATP-binding cassette subfamily C member 4 isoform X1 [Rhipicephalus sanguineus]|uniref:ATP-binding cassette subfamily C member 4 isoform X1 n=1 Tax=Rhipicephalus sanguineus TaxID=34632 RepID=UPI0018935E7F|nr:ATP-binding cassette subfamily C member 4 isoform X1 [Rhipicephalus sanguineus]